jgi:hypothetical protein
MSHRLMSGCILSEMLQDPLIQTRNLTEREYLHTAILCLYMTHTVLVCDDYGQCGNGGE